MIAFAQEYINHFPGTDVRIFGRPGSLEEKLAQASGFCFLGIDSAPLFGARTLRSLADIPVHHVRGFFRARRLLRDDRPDIVVGFGAFVTIGALFAAMSLGVKTAIYEANRLPGRANRLLRPFCGAVFVNDCDVERWPAWRHAIRVGYPLRRGILDLAAHPRRRGADRPLGILVTGGTFGNRFLNQHVPSVISRLREDGLEIAVIHQTGPDVPPDLGDRYTEAAIPARISDFFNDMASIYAETDFVICGAGAGTLAELSALGIPALVVPVEKVADQHQFVNATAFAECEDAIVVREPDWDISDVATRTSQALYRILQRRGAAGDVTAEVPADTARDMIAECERLVLARRNGAMVQ